MNTIQMGESQRVRPLTLVEPNHQQGTGTTVDLTDMLGAGPSRAQAAAYLNKILPILTENLPWGDGADEQRTHFNQAGRVISVLLHREANQADVDAALEACGAIYDLRMGGCLVHMYGWANTPENRDYWLDYEQQNLANAIRDLTGALPERAAA